MKKIVIFLLSLFICSNIFSQTEHSNEQTNIVVYKENYIIPKKNINATKQIIKQNIYIIQLFTFTYQDRTFYLFHSNESDYSHNWSDPKTNPDYSENSYEWLEVLEGLVCEIILSDDIVWNKFCTRIAVLDTTKVENVNNMFYYTVDIEDFMFKDWFLKLKPDDSTVYGKHSYLWH